MDLSKLPRLSETDKHTPQPTSGEPVQQDVTPAHRVETVPASGGGDAWISIAIGVILLLMSPRFLQWTASRVIGTSFNEFMLDGVVVPYPQTPEFWSDLGPTSFAIVLICEGLVLSFWRKRSSLWFALVVTCVVTLYNLGYLLGTYATYGLPLVSAFAVVFGIYIAMGQWRMLHGREV